MAEGKTSLRYVGLTDGKLRDTPDILHVGDRQLPRGEIIPGFTADEAKKIEENPYYEDFEIEVNPKEDD